MYTYAKTHGNKILLSIVKDKKLTFETKSFEPELFVESIEENTEFKTFLENNKSVQRIVFDNIKEFNNYKYQNKNVENNMFYNDIQAEYQYIFKHFKNDVIPEVKIHFLDIEAGKDKDGNVNADSENATCPISLIQVYEKDTRIVYLFGTQYNYNPNENKKVQELIKSNRCNEVIYVYCSCEYDLLETYVKFVYYTTPAIITAYNGNVYDFPMIVNRLKINGFKENILSPFGTGTRTKVNNFGKEFEYQMPDGFVFIDYLELYKKIILFGKSRDSFSLEFTTEDVLGESGKLDYTVLGFESIVDLIKYNYNPKLDLEENSERLRLYNQLQTEPDNIHFQEQLKKEIHDNVFCFYGAMDVVTMNELEEKLGAIDIVINVAYEMGVNYLDMLTTVKPWTVYLYRYLYDKKLVLPGKAMYKHKSFGGGFQFSNPGLYEWVGVADYSALYTSIQIETNISPETYISPENIPKELWNLIKPIYECDKFAEDIYINKSVEEKEEIRLLLEKHNMSLSMNGNCYDISKQGIIPECLEEMVFKRKDIQKEAHRIEMQMNASVKDSDEYKELSIIFTRLDGKQKTQKTLINAYYGAQGEKSFVLYNPDNAESVTSYGRFSIKTTSKHISDFMNDSLGTKGDNVVYIHTDSGYFDFSNIVKSYFGTQEVDSRIKAEFLSEFIENVIVPKIDESTNKNKHIVNAYKSFMKMDIEAILDKALITGKSRMAVRTLVTDGIILNKDKIKIKITGLQIKRSDTPKFCRDKLMKIIDIIFDGDNDSLINFVDSTRKEFETINIDKIGVPIGINEMEKYKDIKITTPQHVRGAFVYNNLIDILNLNYEKIYKGNKVKVLFLTKNNIIRSDVISIKNSNLIYELGLDKYIDYDRQFLRTFKSALKKLIEPINWNIDRNSYILHSLF